MVNPLLRLALVAMFAMLLMKPADAFWKSWIGVQEEEEDPMEDFDPRDYLVEDEPVVEDKHVDVPPTKDEPVEYGVDVSFPMHYDKVSTNYPWLHHNVDPASQTPREYEDMVLQPLGDRQKFYDEFLDGCVKKFKDKSNRCIQNERDRIAMSLRQPQSMQNYTDVGFKKIRTPDHVWKLIKEFWDTNKDNAAPENWGIGNTYTNNWASPTAMVSVENTGLRGGGAVLKQKIWNAARDTIQEWTGQELTQCSLYGIRIYYEGSVLATHVDRLPLVSSAIINVAQDVDEPWPLEVYGHDGKATNVTMLPGDMVLYESHSVLHGRPFPLKGRFMANLFIHFEPNGHSLRHAATEAAKEGGQDVHAKYREALARGAGGHEADQADDLPSYIIPGSPEVDNWRRRHPQGAQKPKKEFTTGSLTIHEAAQKGDLKSVMLQVTSSKTSVNAKDSNGWTALHESSRGGHLDVVKFLIANGADLNAKTGNGGTPLYWAKKKLGEGHPVVDFLVSEGAVESGPEF